MNSLEQLEKNKEEFKSLIRALRRNNGFGIFFVECPPIKNQNIIKEIQENIDKKIKVLELTKPIDSLYRLVKEKHELVGIDILIITGLEYSLIEYEKTTFNNDIQATKINNAKSQKGVPRFLGYLNLQRDNFRNEFDTTFIFMLPEFGIDYFINRAPDFFDWRSGHYKFSFD